MDYQMEMGLTIMKRLEIYVTKDPLKMDLCMEKESTIMKMDKNFMKVNSKMD